MESASGSRNEEEEEKRQKARSYLRERFLRIITQLAGSECTLKLHSNTKITGTFRGNDIEFETLLMEKLKTPFAEIPHAKVRSSDVMYIEFCT